MSKSINFIMLFLLVITMTLVSSVPPVTTVQQFSNGYTIVEMQHQELKLSEDYNFYFYLYNTSNGIKIDNSTVNCHFYLASSQGVLLIEGENVYQPNGYWYINISGSYFNETGYYHYGVDCSDGLGGAVSGTLQVTANGNQEPSGIVIVFYTLIFLGVFLSMLILFFNHLEKMVTLELEFKQAVMIISSYLAMFMFYYLCTEYLGNLVVNNLLELMIDIGAVTHVFIVLVVYMLSFIMNYLKFRNKSKVTY